MDRPPVHELSAVNGHSLRFKYRATTLSTNSVTVQEALTRLKSAGCERIFREKASGGRWDRPDPVVAPRDQRELLLKSSNKVDLKASKELVNEAVQGIIL